MTRVAQIFPTGVGPDMSAALAAIYDAINQSASAADVAALEKFGKFSTPIFAATDYSADSGSWTVAKSNLLTDRWCLKGNEMTVILAMTNTTTVAGGPPIQLRKRIPGNRIAAYTAVGPIRLLDNGTFYSDGSYRVTADQPWIEFSRHGATWAVGAGIVTQVFMTGLFEVK